MVVVAAAGRSCLAATVPIEPTHCSRAPNGAREAMMTKVWTVLAIVASFLLVAPVIESGTPSSVPVFQAVGNACDGGGGGGW
jgi:hypothetical protein